jgi:hypothetical protein
VAEPEAKSSWKTIGYVVGGVGVAGLAVGSVFGLVAISQNSDAKCDKSTSICAKPQSEKDAKTSATISTVGFVAGGVLAAAGIGIVLFAPSSTNATEKAAVLTLSPYWTPGGGGLGLGGAF